MSCDSPDEGSPPRTLDGTLGLVAVNIVEADKCTKTCSWEGMSGDSTQLDFPVVT